MKPPSILWVFVSLRGRISRQVYWLAYLALLCLNAVLVGQLFGEEASYHRLAQLALPYVVIATFYTNVAVAVKRLHDVGYSGFLAAALFIPFINLFFTIWVGILPGSAGANAYGDDPDRPPS